MFCVPSMLAVPSLGTKALAQKAVKSLEIAKKKQETPEIYANLASAYLMAGEGAKAKEALVKAAGMFLELVWIFTPAISQQIGADNRTPRFSFRR